MKARSLLIVALLAVALVSSVSVVGTAYAQETVADPVQNLTQLIVAVGALVGSIATIVSLVGSKYLASHGDNQLVKTIVHGADGLKGTDQALAEAQDDIATLVDVITRISPDAKAELEKSGKDIDAIRQRAEEYKADIDRIYKVTSKYV